MKHSKRIVAAVIVMALLACAMLPAFAASKLAKPEIVEVDAGKSSIKIDWEPVKHADSYYVYRATSKNGTYHYLDEAESSWYRDYSITKGQRYYYKVRAVSFDDEYSNSAQSKWRSGKVKKPAPAYSTSQTVYITNTGSKYHRYGCRYLHSSCIKTSLSKAKNAGYTACSVCW